MTKILNTQPGDCIELYDHEQHTGTFSFGRDEVSIRAQGPDPSAIGVAGSNIPVFGHFIGRFVDAQGHEHAAVQWMHKKDERTRHRPDLLWFETSMFVYGPIDPAIPNDDGARCVFMATHDYIWMRGLSPTPNPEPPAIDLPPSTTPPQPQPLIGPEEYLQRVLDVEAMHHEFGDLEFDAGQVQSYLQGRSTPQEFHDKLVERAGDHRPELHRPGRLY